MVLFQSLHINVGDILNIQNFIEHAQFHKENYGDNLLSFISKHYGQDKEEHGQNEGHDHDKLPFSGCSIVHAPIALITKHFIPVLSRFDNFEKQDNFSYQMGFSSLTIFDIFQPPRSA